MPEFAQLIDGYRRFRSDNYQRFRDRWDELAHGQQPPVMIIACCDSRVDPATVFDTLPGQAFVVRNVANLVPPYDIHGRLHGVSSAIEFGVTGLGVRHIVVMGHGACGGIAAALKGGDQGRPGTSFLDQWLAIVADVRAVVLANPKITDKQLALEQAAVRQSLANLRTFPYVAEKETAAELKLHGCHFAIADGRLSVLDEAEESFRPV
ncbi:carbonic anhydrase [Sphingomonas mesophila]|uniref:carbonic anhydrase n=1 Tax=Sphingomonas mesophila TaxID=2303576 RepID=UPI000E581C9E|nr:carbonic anhydrase [Sphingomonas mesophila]